MIIPVPALPLLFQIAVANGVPEWDVTSSCRAGAVATQGASPETRLKACIDSEHRTRDKLADLRRAYHVTQTVDRHGIKLSDALTRL